MADLDSLAGFRRGEGEEQREMEREEESPPTLENY